MKLLGTLLVAALAAYAGRRLGDARAGAAPPAAKADPARIAAAIPELRRANELLVQELERRAGLLAAAPVQASEIGDEEIAAALARWREAHPQEEAPSAAPGKTERASRPRADELDLASIPMSEIVQALAKDGFGLEQQDVFQKLRELGRIDEYVAAIEALAAADPENADLQVALGHAYLQKLFGVGSTPEAGPWAMKSDAAFDRALELDDHNWAARFSKAVSLTNWPAFLGRGPEAIEHFEILLEQQASQPQREEFAMTYLFLGNMQQASGARDDAIATWRAGLERFPDREDLRRALELAAASDASTRPASR